MFDTTFLVWKLKLFYIPFQMDKCSRPMCFFTKQKVSSNCGKQLCYFHLFGRHVTHKTLYQIQSSVLQLKLQVFWDCQKTKTLEEKNLGEMFVVPKDFLRGIAFVWTWKLSSATGLRQELQKNWKKTQKLKSLRRNLVPKDLFCRDHSLGPRL